MHDGYPPSDHLLRTLAAVPVASRVLDLGCGAGRHAAPLAQLGFDVWACDRDASAVAAARARLAPLIGDDEAGRRVSTARAAALGFPDDHFDWIVAYGAFDVAEDAAELFDMLAETRRVLRPGGWVYVAMRSATGGPDLTPENLAKLCTEARLALAETPAAEASPEPVVRGIFRKVDSDTIG